MGPAICSAAHPQSSLVLFSPTTRRGPSTLDPDDDMAPVPPTRSRTLGRTGPDARECRQGRESRPRNSVRPPRCPVAQHGAHIQRVNHRVCGLRPKGARLSRLRRGGRHVHLMSERFPELLCSPRLIPVEESVRPSHFLYTSVLLPYVRQSQATLEIV